MGIKAFFQKRFQRWLERRLPPIREITLDQRKLFIFPSKQGGGFLLLLFLLWLIATNYESNLLFVVCYLLTSFFIVAIYHTHQNLSGIQVKVLPIHPVFVGDNCEIPLRLFIVTGPNKDRPAIDLSWRDESNLSSDSLVTVKGEEAKEVHLYLPADQRGWLKTPRITIQTHYPFGWFRCWTHLALQIDALVYPKPIPSGNLPFFKGQGSDSRMALVAGGDDDFVGHRNYEQGMPLQRVDWKIWARGGEMFVKEYGSGVDERLWLDWEYFPGMDTEQRLSRLCDWVLQADRKNLSYGLRLPDFEIVPARGDQQRRKALRALALFDIGSSERQTGSEESEPSESANG